MDAFSGVRPLYDDAAESASAVTRDYVLDVEPERPEPPDGRPPLLSVFGGKITTFRKLAEHALGRLAPFFPRAGGPWTAAAPLPGGDMPDADFDLFRAELARRYPLLPEDLRTHYGRLYGTEAPALLDDARTPSDLGRHWGSRLYEREVEYLRQNGVGASTGRRALAPHQARAAPLPRRARRLRSKLRPPGCLIFLLLRGGVGVGLRGLVKSRRERRCAGRAHFPRHRGRAGSFRSWLTTPIPSPSPQGGGELYAAMIREFFAYYRPHRALFLLDFACAVLSGLLELGFPMAVRPSSTSCCPGRTGR